MTNDLIHRRKWYSLGGSANDRHLYLTFPLILLVVFVAGLFVLLVSTCIKFTQGPLSTTALLERLQELQRKFVSGETINPEAERKELEVLQNKIKTTSLPALITANAGLKKLFFANCLSIQSALSETGLKDRTSWLKLNALMVDFNLQYFGK